jgi:hypothetical protein
MREELATCLHQTVQDLNVVAPAFCCRVHNQAGELRDRDATGLIDGAGVYGGAGCLRAANYAEVVSWSHNVDMNALATVSRP